MLLVCGALAAVHLSVHLLTVPLLTLLAPLSPPLYGLAAGLHSVTPFIARRLTQVRGSAIVTSGMAALFVAATNPSGIIVVVPLLIAGAVIDLVLWPAPRRGARAPREVRYVGAGITAGVLLFAVSLSVFSPEHLTPTLITLTLICRVVGEIGAAVLSRLIVSALRRAGVGRSSADPLHDAARTSRVTRST